MSHKKPSYNLSLAPEVTLCVVCKDMLESADLISVAMQATDLEAAACVGPFLNEIHWDTGLHGKNRFYHAGLKWINLEQNVLAIKSREEGGGSLQTYICPKSHIKFHVSGLSSRETNVSLETCF